MFEVTLTKDNETRQLLIFDTELKAQDFITEKIASNSFGSIGTYSLQYSNVSATILLEQKLLKRTKKRAFGDLLIDKVSVLNESKGGTSTDTDNFMENAFVKKLLNHLKAGNIDTAKDLIIATNLSALFSAQEKAAFLSEIQDFLNRIDQ